MPIRRLVRSIALLLGLVALSSQAALAADDPDFIHMGVGWWDFNRPANHAAEFDLAYRSDYKLWLLKPHAGILGTSDGSIYGYGGFLIDFYFGNRFVVTPSTSVGFYSRGGAKSNLGSPIEFRSGLDLAYRFDDRSRLGVGIYHISNTGLWDKRNPGEETALLFYQMPVHKLIPSWRSPGGNSKASQAAALQTGIETASAKSAPGPRAR
ncbi:MAG: acyloxyacyl hydrolase [Alphaproteobacteria bacterium]|nr:acyloxyacyl hydrolase [Alphaproteobacteria bacterium]